MSPVDISNLERDINIIKKRRGVDTIHYGDAFPPVEKIPFDSPALQRITSGGIPRGRMVRLWGGPSSAKTVCSYLILKSSQEMNLKTAYHNIEKQYDPVLVKNLGVNIEDLLILESTIIEDVVRECQLLLNSVHVHVIDSTSSAVPQDRLNKDPGDWDVGLDARVWIKGLDYLLTAMDKDENTIIYISHASTNFQTKSEKPLGGKEMEHESSMTLHFKRNKWLYYDDEEMLQTEDKLKEKGILGIGGQKEADGQEIVVIVDKSRVCRALRKANMRLDLNTMKFDYTFELMQGAEYFDKYGNIAHRAHTPAIADSGGVKKGGWVSLPNGEKIQGQRALRQRIDEDIELQKLIRKAMLSGN
jgi:RecA/RadA recombinase